MSGTISKNMTANVRKFGVSDPNQYWQERVAAGRASEKRVHQFIAQTIGEYFPAGGNVLDCGVGDGHVFRLCRERYATYGVEFSKEAIGRYDFPTDNIACADLNQGIPEFGVRFDAIVLSMVLHWLNDPEKFLRDAARSLTARGRLFVVIPNITNYHYRLAFLFGKFPSISPSHRNFMTPSEAEQVFCAAGYTIERMACPKKSLKTRLWPRLFGTGILYVLKPIPAANATGAA
jgi:SAM-dependent methyltransferase